MNLLLNNLVNWKTTLTGIVTAVFVLLDTLQIVSIPDNVRTSIVAVLIFILGFFAKDANVHGVK